MIKRADKLAEELEMVKLEDEVMSHKAQIEEKKAIIAQLRKQYGPNWLQVLGFKRMPDLQTLRSLLQSMKKGLKEQAVGNTNLSPLPPSSLRLPISFNPWKK